MISRDDLNYLNMQEIRSLAFRFSIPFHIYYQNQEGRIVKSSEIERKEYILDKLFAYSQGERTFQKIVYPKSIVSFEPFKQLYTKNDLLLYRDFKSTNKALVDCLKQITNHRFYFGAIAFIEAHKVWRSSMLCLDTGSCHNLKNGGEGKRISLEEYAELFLKALDNHTKPRDEWAFIRAMQNGMLREEWKLFRQKKVEQIIAHFVM